MLAGATEVISRQFLTFTRVKSAPGRWKFALHATAITAVAVTLIGLVFGVTLGLAGLTGAFVGLIAMDRPIRSRLLILGGMDTAYVAGVALGALTGHEPVLLTIVLTAISVVAVLAYNSLVAEPPGPMFLIMGPAISSYLPTTGLPIVQVIAVGAIGCVGASVASVLLQLVTAPTRAERRALDEATVAVTVYLEADRGVPARPEVVRLGDEAFASVFAASMILEDAVGREPRRHRWRRMNTTLRQLHLALIQRIVELYLPGNKVVISGADQRRYMGRPDLRYLVRWGLSRSSLPWLSARRMGAAVLLACAISYGLHIGHPYWSVLTTALVMSVTSDRLSLTHRAMHRLAGTIVGIALFFAIHAAHPTGITVVLIALVLVFCIQSLAVRNYALAAIVVTPMALLVSTAGDPFRPIGEVVRERVLETFIGALASILMIWLTGRRAPIALVRRQFRRALRSMERLLLLLADGRQSTPAGYEARRDLSFEQLQCSRILRIAATDLPRQLQEWDELETALNQVAHVVLAACWTTDPPTAVDAERMSRMLARMIAGLPPIGTTPVDAEAIAEALREILLAGGARLA